MDPPLINDVSLSEIWPFSSNSVVVVGDSAAASNAGMLLGLQMATPTVGATLIDGLFTTTTSSNHIVASINNSFNGSLDESTLTQQHTGPRLRRDYVSQHHSSKLLSATTSAHADSNSNSNSNSNYLKESNVKCIKTSGFHDENGSSKAGGESSSADGEQPAEKPAEPLKDYIHVRARRGQATDSHSLAERARREKISERMKILQDLVPGCNKVIGKALVLDEIINYIQSLQRQVEFLSMKLEAVNSGMIPSINIFHSKDVNQLGMPSFDQSGMMFSAQAARELAGAQSEWLRMQLGGSFERTA